jgi:hypothetical protein
MNNEEKRKVIWLKKKGIYFEFKNPTNIEFCMFATA